MSMATAGYVAWRAANPPRAGIRVLQLQASDLAVTVLRHAIRAATSRACRRSN